MDLNVCMTISSLTWQHVHIKGSLSMGDAWFCIAPHAQHSKEKYSICLENRLSHGDPRRAKWERELCSCDPLCFLLAFACVCLLLCAFACFCLLLFAFACFCLLLLAFACFCLLLLQGLELQGLGSNSGKQFWEVILGSNSGKQSGKQFRVVVLLYL